MPAITSCPTGGIDSVSQSPIPFHHALDQWLSTLDVEVAALTECQLGAGHGMEFHGGDLPGLHFVLEGNGDMIVNGQRLEMRPDMMIITPPHQDYRFTTAQAGEPVRLQSVQPAYEETARETRIKYCKAGEGQAAVKLICGHFRARNAASSDLFAGIGQAVSEIFQPGDQLGHRLKWAVEELNSGQLGAKAMATAILQQILVMLFRRAMLSSNDWIGKLGIVTDRQVSRAFAAMQSNPGEAHSLASLAQIASLSRSAFVDRFNRAFGCAPMTMLRDLRLQRAHDLLQLQKIPVDQIAREVGYQSRSSFTRAFRQKFGNDPSSARNKSEGSTA